MTKEFRIRLTDPQVEVLKSMTELSGEDTPENYLHIAILQSLETDIDLYCGVSENVKQIMYSKLGITKEVLQQ